MRARLIVPISILLAALACQPGERERAEDETGERSEEMALPPSARAPQASEPGHVPDTVRAGERRLSPAELDVDSIVGRYRNHYAAEAVEAEAIPSAGQIDPQLIEIAQRRTALDFGYVEVGAWSHMEADLTEAQRRELTARIDAVNQELAREFHGPQDDRP